MTDAAAALVLSKDGPRWTIDLHGLSVCRDVLGADVLTAFCQCFIHGVQLHSLSGLAYLFRVQYAPQTDGYASYATTLAWLTTGVLRAWVSAVGDLRRLLDQRGVLGADPSAILALGDAERQWNDDACFAAVRDLVAFRIESGVVGRGLAALAPASSFTLAHGTGPIREDASSLGREALIRGCGLSLEDFDGFLKRVEASDFHAAVQGVFFHLLERAGLALETRASLT